MLDDSINAANTKLEQVNQMTRSDQMQSKKNSMKNVYTNKTHLKPLTILYRIYIGVCNAVVGSFVATEKKRGKQFTSL